MAVVTWYNEGRRSFSIAPPRILQLAFRVQMKCMSLAAVITCGPIISTLFIRRTVGAIDGFERLIE